MRITTLGTGSPIPDPNRAGPATLVQAGGHNLLFDCGRGVLMRLAAAGVMPPGCTRLPDASALRPRDRLQRRDHHTLGHVARDEPAPGHRPAGNRRVRATHARDARRRHRLPPDHHDDLTWEPAVRRARDPGRRRVRARRRARRRGAHRPPAGGPDRRLPGRARRPARSSSRATPCRAMVSTACPRAPTCTCRPWSARRRARRAVPRLQDILDYHSSCADAGRTAAAAA